MADVTLDNSFVIASIKKIQLSVQGHEATHFIGMLHISTIDLICIMLMSKQFAIFLYRREASTMRQF